MNPFPGVNGDNIRQVELASIEKFLVDRRAMFKDKDVLDYGCGSPDTCRKPMPYKELIVASGGRYFGYDPALGLNKTAFMKGPYDIVVCTQVIQQIPDPIVALKQLCFATREGGYLLMTYPTVWPEMDDEPELWRFTQKGMAFMLEEAGWTVVDSVPRGKIDIPGFPLHLGYGVVAQVVT